MLELQRFSTDSLPPQRRIEYWNEVTCSALTAQVADPVDRSAFCGRMTCLDLGEMRLVELNASGSTVTRTRAHTMSPAQPVYLVRLALSGNINALHEGREIRLGAGDFALCDTSRPYQMFFRQAIDVLIIRIPRDRLLQYIGHPESMCGVLMRGDEGLSGLASRHLREIWRSSQEFLDHGASSRIADMTLQLLASAYSAVPRAKADRSWLSAAHRAQVIEHIEHHLSDPDLSPTTIAAALRITPSYLHRVFSGESGTISRYILRRRLEECARTLKDPLQTTRSVTDIAFALGFNSLPHFSRVFRERYDTSPSDYRRDFSSRRGGQASGAP